MPVGVDMIQLFGRYFGQVTSTLYLGTAWACAKVHAPNKTTQPATSHGKACLHVFRANELCIEVLLTPQNVTSDKTAYHTSGAKI
jgi:hypothetical protein